MSKKIGITFATYNNISYTLKAIKSIYENNSKNELLITIVDNGSVDGTPDIVKKRFPNIDFIRNKRNNGCAIAWNQGLDYLSKKGCDYLILTQNDMIISKEAIDNCVEFLEENLDYKIASPISINSEWDSSFDLSQEELNSIYEKAKKKFGSSIQPTFSFYFFVMRPEVFKSVRFDEFFLKVFYEDCDFYNNIYYNKIVCCQKIEFGLIFHKFSATVSKTRNHGNVENKKYYCNKWKNKNKKTREGMEYVANIMGVNVPYKSDKYRGIDLKNSGLL